ncbi:MAG TPA: LytTR family DNA-binding domain-containing protein [Spirosoma sp.]|nr:LytTR family DNA-binding domain-containing protein [Spirosoma sp.]
MDGLRHCWLIAIGSVLIGYFFVAVGTGEGVFELLSNPMHLRDLLGASLMTAVVWLCVRIITIWLDRRYDWFEQPLRRITAQLLLGVGLSVSVSLGMALVYFPLVVGQPIAESNYPIYEFPISVLFIVGFNVLYLGLYLYQKARKSTTPAPPNTEATQSAPPTRKTLIVNSGLRNIPLSTDEVAYAFIDQATVFLTTFAGSKYLVNNSLDELSRELPHDVFFRVNRQFIIHRRACSSYLNDTHGKLKVEVQPALPKDIIVSQQRTPEFKKWLEEGY